MSKIISQINNNYIGRKLFWFLLISLLFVSFMYAYFVNQTIYNIVERKKIESEIVSLNSEISKLEFNYIALKNNIDLDYARSVGFINVKKVIFAYKKSTEGDLSINKGFYFSD